jgi:peptide/nickel transport system substrate-binding protein
MLYDDAPYVVTYYYDNREAYRSDRFTGFVPQPSPNGSLLFQYGTWSYENVKPVSAESPAASGSASASTGGGTTESSSSNVPLIVGGVVALLAVLGIGVAVGRRGGRSDDDEE